MVILVADFQWLICIESVMVTATDLHPNLGSAPAGVILVLAGIMGSSQKCSCAPAKVLHILVGTSQPFNEGVEDVKLDVMLKEL